MTVDTEEEYFFVMAADIAVKSTWIYLHQRQRSLCLHKLDKTLTYDEIDTCAERYARMASGQVQNMAEQMIVCMYTKGDLLSFTISRPSYDRTQRTSAISVRVPVFQAFKRLKDYKLDILNDPEKKWLKN